MEFNQLDIGHLSNISIRSAPAVPVTYDRQFTPTIELDFASRTNDTRAHTHVTSLSRLPTTARH